MDSHTSTLLFKYGAVSGILSCAESLRKTAAKTTDNPTKQLLISMAENFEAGVRLQAVGENELWGKG